MDDLTKWLGAQLHEDEALARYTLSRNAELPQQLRSAGEQVRDLYGDPEPPEDGVSPADRAWWLAKDAADWIDQNGPARVLREIDAKRQMIETFTRRYEAAKASSTSTSLGAEWVVRADVLRLLALPYADRPGYREEWRP